MSYQIEKLRGKLDQSLSEEWTKQMVNDKEWAKRIFELGYLSINKDTGKVERICYIDGKKVIKPLL